MMSMCILTISCLTMPNLPWFMDLTFQVSKQYCSLPHQILLSSPDASTTECCFHFSPAILFSLGLLVVLLHSSPVAYWTPSGLGVSYLFVLLCSSWDSHGKYSGVVCHSLLQWITFCQNSPLCPICLGCPYTVWLIASSSYASPFATTRPWSVKGMTNLDSVLKSRDIILMAKVHIVKPMAFPVITYGCESWTVKKAEHRKIDCLELWCWRRLLRVPWTARKSNQSILREINPEYWLEGLMLKLKLHPFCHLMRTAGSLEKSLMLGKIEVRRRQGHRRIKWLMASAVQWMWTWANFRRQWGTETPGVLQTEQQRNVYYLAHHPLEPQTQSSKFLTFACLSCKLNCLKPNLICFTCQGLLTFQSSSFDSVPRTDCNFWKAL